MRNVSVYTLFLILMACPMSSNALQTADITSGTEEITEISPEFLKEDDSVDIDAIVKYFEDLYRSDSSIATAELKVVRPRRERTLKMNIKTKGKDKALIVIEEPPREKGTATLKVDKNLWNYLPRIRRTIRIPPSMMLSSWMGSDFTNDDLVRESSFSEDYTYELVGATKDPEGWLIRFTAKEGIVGLWDHFDLILSRDGRIPIRSHWYNRRGELSRIMNWEEVKQFNGRRMPARIILEPTDQEGHLTEMYYHEIDFDVNVPESTFSLSELEQKR